MFSLILFLATILQISLAEYTADGHNVISYWGQAAYQERLSYYCNLKNMDIVMLSFVRPYNDEVTFDFGNACSGETCPEIAEDIKVCQSLGIKVFISLGGTYSTEVHYSVPESDTTTISDKLYTLFGPQGTVFPGATIDGFDFDMEGGDNTGYASLMQNLKDKFGKDHLISATPQCPFPDKTIGTALTESANIDMALIQFYNNPSCMAPGVNNWSTWKDALENKFANKNMKLYFGVPGSSTAAGVGYVSISTLKSKTKKIVKDPAFGGFMVWDVAFSYNNSNYLAQVKKYLGTVKTTKITTTSSTTSSSTTSSIYSTSTTFTTNAGFSYAVTSRSDTYDITSVTYATTTGTFATGTGDGTTFATGTGDGTVNTKPIVAKMSIIPTLMSAFHLHPFNIHNVSNSTLLYEKRGAAASPSFTFTAHQTLQTRIVY